MIVFPICRHLMIVCPICHTFGRINLLLYLRYDS
nr:MAG TPA: calcium-binding and coiled-coil domain-containing protein [Bacteriophage sp.]